MFADYIGFSEICPEIVYNVLLYYTAKTWRLTWEQKSVSLCLFYFYLAAHILWRLKKVLRIKRQPLVFDEVSLAAYTTKCFKG